MKVLNYEHINTYKIIVMGVISVEFNMSGTYKYHVNCHKLSFVTKTNCTLDIMLLC